ncbi:MAG: FAD-dependent monooxygenase [Kutzneria sp.]|nr:FAD-dependent monooxygenase [Kutzneria sp.]
MYDVHERRVLIIGGGLVGLCASLFLSHHGVESMVVEKHTGTSPQPKARRINLRTMELFRQIGIASDVLHAADALADFQGMAAGRTLADARRLPFTLPGGVPNWDDISPVSACLCAQDALEPVLRGLAADRGVELRFGAEVADFVADGAGVTATVSAEDGSTHTVRADYLIAADGARGRTREKLDIGRGGRGSLGSAANVYFRADLSDLVRGREFNLCQIEHPAAPGGLVSVNGTDRWIFMTAATEDRAEGEWVDLIRTALGAAGVDVEILSVLRWEPGMFVADRFSAGRVFLAGDAAHVMPPYAAAGANTGIQDAHNLAWKLAMVLTGVAAPELLESYHAERRPIGWFTADQSSIRSADLRRPYAASADGTPLADPLALILGYQYPSGAFIADGSTAATDRLDLAGQPGTRLPHHRLNDGGSTLDLVGRRLTLLTGSAAGPWHPAAVASPVEVRQVDGVGVDWNTEVGVGENGAILVRPDHIVAWRCPEPGDNPRSQLDTALRRVLGN